MESPAYGVSNDSKSNGPEGSNEPEHLLMDPIYTIPTSGKNKIAPYTTEGDVAHTYERIQETFTYKNNAGPHRPHSSVPSHLELGDGDGEREYATLRSPGHEYAILEQPSHMQGQNHQKPWPYEFPVANQYEKPELQRPIPNYPPQGYEEIVAMASGRREYAEPDLDTPHSYATLEHPASK